MTWAKPQNSTFSNSPILIDDRPITVRRRVGEESSSATGRFSSPHLCSSTTESLFIDEWVTKYSSATGRFTSPHPCSSTTEPLFIDEWVTSPHRRPVAPHQVTHHHRHGQSLGTLPTGQGPYVSACSGYHVGDVPKHPADVSLSVLYMSQSYFPPKDIHTSIAASCTL